MLNKISLFPYQDSAVGFYRILQPGRCLKREKLSKEALSLPFSGDKEGHNWDYKDDFYLKLTKNSNVMWSTVVYRDNDFLRLMNLRKHNSNYNINKYCKLIYDMDDNLFSVPMDNPAYQDAKNLKINFDRCLRGCDGVTVSVPMLKDVYSHLNKNIFVMPNGIDFKIWDKVKTKKNTRKIRIGWRGAFGHKDDYEMIESVLMAIKKDYPNVEIVVLGWKPKYYTEHHEWVSAFEYPNKLGSLNIDIAVVPLVDSAYNRCKSNIAYLEWAALKVPVVLSPTENQKGMKSFEARSNYDWYVALERLIKDKHLRLKSGQSGYDFVKKNYDIHKLVHPLAEWMEKLPYRKDLEP